MIVSSFFIPFHYTLLAEAEMEDIKEIIITSDEDIGFYGSMIIDDELHFIYATNCRDNTKLCHYSIQSGKIKKRDIIDVAFSIGNDFSFSATSDQSFYFTYKVSTKNETTDLYTHEYYCYYFDALTNKGEKIHLLDVTKYFSLDNSNPDVLGVELVNNKTIFLIDSITYTQSTTDIIAINLEQNIETTHTYIESGRLEHISSCYNTNNDCAYFIYYECNSDGNDFRLYKYNFTSCSLTFSANCSFSHLDFLTRAGKLLYDQVTDSKYFICPLDYAGSDSTTEFALFEYNSTASTFNLSSITDDAFATFSTKTGVGFETENEYYNAIINNSLLSIIYRKSVAHSDLNQLALITYPLDDSEDWNYVNLNLGDNINPFHSRFIYDATSKTYCDSYLIGYIYEDSPYHPIAAEGKIITSFGIYGPYANDISKPYFIRAINSTYYWLIITSSIIVPITLGGVGYYYLRRYKQKQKNKEEN